LQVSEQRPLVLLSEPLSDACKALTGDAMEGQYPLVLLREEENPLKKIEEEAYGVFVVSDADPHVADAGFWRELRNRPDPVKVVVIADREDVAGAVRLMRYGAFDVLVEPVEPGRLVKTLNGALAAWEENRAGRADEQKKKTLTTYDELVGISPEMQLIQQTINSIAPSDASVFIWGESGTGKELVAKAFHSRSRRAAQPFIAINCAALPKDILENELFGHEKGAFTGALNQKPGCFEMADRGTLFLDEIGEMSAATQAKLLRVLESQTFRRLGGRNEVKVDVRMVAATNRKLSDALEQGLVRTDLYYRLSVVEMELPPLRERRDDIVPLARHFLKMFAFKYAKDIKGFSDDYLEMLQSYQWPGNVRELRNTIERATVICPGEVISTNDLPAKILKTQQEIMHITIPIGSSVEEAEKKLILETLASVGNNKAKAARILGVSRKTLHNKLNSFKWSMREG